MGTTTASRLTSPSDLERLLRASRGGDEGARGQLFELLYDELRRLAAVHMQGERRDHTLAPTALVHETFLRLFPSNLPCHDRAQLLALASQVMRHILIDCARRRLARKRDGQRVALDLDLVPESEPVRDEYLLALDRALSTLSEREPQVGKVVELRFFGGYSVEETAEVMEISGPTVKRRWRLARAWLHREIGRELKGGER